MLVTAGYKIKEETDGVHDDMKFTQLNTKLCRLGRFPFTSVYVTSCTTYNRSRFCNATQFYYIY